MGQIMRFGISDEISDGLDLVREQPAVRARVEMLLGHLGVGFIQKTHSELGEFLGVLGA